MHDRDVADFDLTLLRVKHYSDEGTVFGGPESDEFPTHGLARLPVRAN